MSKFSQFLNPSDETLQYQIANYHTLKRIDSYKGQAILLFLAIFFTDIILAIFNIQLYLGGDSSGGDISLFLQVGAWVLVWITGIALALPFLILAGQGKRIAFAALSFIILAITFYTLGSDFLFGILFEDNFVITVIRYTEIALWSFLFILFLNRAHLAGKVEIIRLKQDTASGSSENSQTPRRRRSSGCLMAALVPVVLIIGFFVSSSYLVQKQKLAIPPGLLGPTEETFPGYKLSVHQSLNIDKPGERKYYALNYWSEERADQAQAQISNSTDQSYDDSIKEIEEAKFSKDGSPCGYNIPQRACKVSVETFEWNGSQGVIYSHNSSYGMKYDLHYNDRGYDLNITFSDVPPGTYSTQRLIEVLETLKRY